MIEMWSRRIGGLMVLAVVGWSLAGCQDIGERMNDRLAGLDDETLVAVLREAVAAQGGLSAWVATDGFDAAALATLAGDQGARTLIEQHYAFDGQDGLRLRVCSREPGGVFEEVIGPDGRVRVTRSDIDSSAAALQQGTGVKLRLMAQAFGGPAGLLLNRNWTLRSLGSSREAGRLVHKIEATGPMVGPADRLVVWVDAANMLPSRWWLCSGDQPGGRCLMAAVRDYRTLETGLKVPATIDLAPSRAAGVYSERAALTVELLSVTTRQAR